jgi:hypothetical protein
MHHKPPLGQAPITLTVAQQRHLARLNRTLQQAQDTLQQAQGELDRFMAYLAEEYELQGDGWMINDIRQGIVRSDAVEQSTAEAE